MLHHHWMCKNDYKLGLHFGSEKGDAVSNPQSNPQFIFQVFMLLYNSLHLYCYVSTLEGVYINLRNLSLGSPKTRHRFVLACSLSLEVFLVKSYLLKPLK